MKVKLTTEDGRVVDAIAPVVLTASRVTDIPAFYAKWFFNRLEKGYAVWVSPYTHRPMYVSFERVRVIVFWTKNPQPMMQYLDILDQKGIHYYFQYSLNDYEAEGFESALPPLTNRIKSFKQLADRIGKERVVWRFEPIIFTHLLTPDELLRRISDLAWQLKGCTEKLVISFLKTNKQITERLRMQLLQNDMERYEAEEAAKVPVDEDEDEDEWEEDWSDEWEEEDDDEDDDLPLPVPMTDYLISHPSNQKKDELAKGLMYLQVALEKEGYSLALSACAEEANLRAWGFLPNKCVDDELMARLWPDDEVLAEFLRTARKDKGQRKLCRCIESKDVGMRNSCTYGCRYCNVCTSDNEMKKILSRHTDTGEGI